MPGLWSQLEEPAESAVFDAKESPAFERKRPGLWIPPRVRFEIDAPMILAPKDQTPGAWVDLFGEPPYFWFPPRLGGRDGSQRYRFASDYPQEYLQPPPPGGTAPPPYYLKREPDVFEVRNASELPFDSDSQTLGTPFPGFAPSASNQATEIILPFPTNRTFARSSRIGIDGMDAAMTLNVRVAGVFEQAMLYGYTATDSTIFEIGEVPEFIITGQFNNAGTYRLKEREPRSTDFRYNSNYSIHNAIILLCVTVGASGVGVQKFYKPLNVAGASTSQTVYPKRYDETVRVPIGTPSTGQPIYVELLAVLPRYESIPPYDWHEADFNFMYENQLLVTGPSSEVTPNVGAGQWLRVEVESIEVD